jgi:hypothetical protein
LPRPHRATLQDLAGEADNRGAKRTAGATKTASSFSVQELAMALEVTLHNQDLDDLLVDVRDLNLPGQPFILNGFTLPQSQLFKILVQENSSGSAGNIF